LVREIGWRRNLTIDVQPDHPGALKGLAGAGIPSARDSQVPLVQKNALIRQIGDQSYLKKAPQSLALRR
jgi:hypothetical protein